MPTPLSILDHTTNPCALAVAWPLEKEFGGNGNYLHDAFNVLVKSSK